MQINNNMSQQNFGMAFKIKGDGGANWVRKQSKDTLDTLSKVAEELKDTQFYHLFADEGGLYVSEVYTKAPKYTDYKFPNSADLRFRTLQNKPNEIELDLVGSDLNLGAVNKVSKTLRFEDAKVAEEFKKKLIGSHTSVVRLANLTKAMDANLAYKHTVEAAEKAAEKERLSLADDLISKFTSNN